jgi:hypothetical protein
MGSDARTARALRPRLLGSRVLLGTAVLAAAAGLAACGSGSGSAATTTTTTSTTPATVQNLTVTPAVRLALLAAAAAGHNLPVTDFTGLTKGDTYYAYDPAAQEYWAGAQLVPSHSSQAAQVSVQDDGAYDLFTKVSGGPWTAYNDGLGTQPDVVCAIVVPSSVRIAWGWSLTTKCGGPA